MSEQEQQYLYITMRNTAKRFAYAAASHLRAGRRAHAVRSLEALADYDPRIRGTVLRDAARVPLAFDAELEQLATDYEALAASDVERSDRECRELGL